MISGYVARAPLGEERLRSTDGDEVVPRAGASRWSLYGWIDDTTAVGIRIHGPGNATTAAELTGRNTVTQMTCTVPDGRCTEYPETTRSATDVSVGFGESLLVLTRTSSSTAGPRA